MQVRKTIQSHNAVIPVMAALPYAIESTSDEAREVFEYDPVRQRTIVAGGRDFSTCRYEESVGGLFLKSRSDTKKDD